MPSAVRAGYLAGIVLALAFAAAPPQVAGQSPRAPRPDLILVNGKVYTADSLHPWVEALAIRGERIVGAGSNAAVRALAGARTRIVDLGGRTVIPGINDAHDHVGAAPFGVTFRTGDAPVPDPTPPQVLDSLRALALRTPAGTWIRATVGSRVLEDTAMRRAALDAATPDHPVLLQSWTGHGALVNSAALRVLGIGDAVRDSFGGWYERDGTGRPTGLLQEYVAWSVERRLISALPDHVLVALFRAYAEEGLRQGITSVQDMAGYLAPATTVRVLRAAQLPIRFRIIPYPIPDSAGLRTAEWRAVAGRVAPRVAVSGMKWVLDGTPIERNALQRLPYADRPGWYGRLNFPADTIRAILAHALATREPLMLHVVGDSSVRLVLGLMQGLAPDSVWRPLRVRIEHADGLAGELIPVARRLGVVVVQNPTHFALDPQMLRHRFGSLPMDFQQLRSLAVAEVPLAFGSDGPRNPFLNIMFAVVHPSQPAEGLTREQAVTAYTRGSAYAEFAEREKGMLAPGMLADLAVLSQDIFTVRPEALPATRSVLTLVGGKVEFDSGDLVATESGRIRLPHKRVGSPPAAGLIQND
ncbi:MAG TPA: amidohydrolase [Gemmatimonadales bacterium]|nr:amidohydrolase [Gemmatimonadales bacterium]